MRHFKFVTIAALVLAMALFTVPSSSQAAVGQDPGTGVDLNGVVWYRVWVTGADLLDPNNWSLTFTGAGDRWFEYYTAADGNTWQSWTGITAFVDADTFVTNGDYWMSSNLSDGAGAVSNYYEYEVGGTFEMSSSLANSSVGFLDYLFEHNDPLTFAGARFEEVEKYNEPGGSFIDNMELWTDLDGDGDYDTAFQSWNEYEAGTGYKEVGFVEINWAANTFNMDYREENTITGDFVHNNKSALDANFNATEPNFRSNLGQYTGSGNNFPTNFNNSGADYYRWMSEGLESHDLFAWKNTSTYDYPGINTGGFASSIVDEQSWNSASGYFSNRFDQRIDTDGDRDLNDFGWQGANPGAYREETVSGRVVGMGPVYNYSSYQKWDAINNQYTQNSSQVYDTGASQASTNFQWDFNQNGFNALEDYRLTTTTAVGFPPGGITVEQIALTDYVSDDLGTGVANSLSYQRTSYLDGTFQEARDERVDNDNDGDLNDYEDKGALRMASSSRYDAFLGQSQSSSETWDPGGDFDPVTGTFGTYTAFYSDSWLNGSSQSGSEYAKDTDNDGTIENSSEGDDLYITASSGFNAFNQQTYAYTRLTEDWDNNRGAFQELRTSSSSIAGTGELRNEAYAVNLGGRVDTWSGFDAEEGYSFSGSETRTWGVSLVGFYNRSNLGGDSLVSSYLYQDTDASTDFDNYDPGNPDSDYEVFIDQFNSMEGSWNYVGYEIEDTDNDTFITQVQGFSAAYDFLYIGEDFGGIGDNRREQLYGYTSGDLAGGMLAKFGTVELWGQPAADTTGLNVSYAKYKWAPGLSANPLDWYYLYDYNI